MAIIPPGIDIRLATIQARLDVVYNRVSVQNNTTYRIKQTVSNNSQTTSSLERPVGAGEGVVPPLATLGRGGGEGLSCYIVGWFLTS